MAVRWWNFQKPSVALPASGTRQKFIAPQSREVVDVIISAANHSTAKAILQKRYRNVQTAATLIFESVNVRWRSGVWRI